MRHWLSSRPICLKPSPVCHSVLNVAAQSIAGLRRSEHITDALASFHWPRAPERIKFKLELSSTGLFMALHLSTYQISCSSLRLCRRDAVIAPVRRLTVFSMSVRRDVLPSAIDRLLLPVLDFGTVYLSMFSLLHHSEHFAKS